MELTEAVKALRTHLGESQQAFATRLGLSMSAIANYERDRAPTGRALAELAAAANEAGRPDLSHVFLWALVSELGLDRHGNLVMFSSGRKEKDAPLETILLAKVTGTELAELLKGAYDVIVRIISGKPEVRTKMEQLAMDVVSLIRGRLFRK